MLGLPPFLTTKEVFSFEDQNNFSGNLGPPRILLPSPILTPWKPMNETPHTQQSYFYPLFLLPPFFTLPGDEEEKEEAENTRRWGGKRRGEDEDEKRGWGGRGEEEKEEKRGWGGRGGGGCFQWVTTQGAVPPGERDRKWKQGTLGPDAAAQPASPHVFPFYPFYLISQTW